MSWIITYPCYFIHALYIYSDNGDDYAAATFEEKFKKQDGINFCLANEEHEFEIEEKEVSANLSLETYRYTNKQDCDTAYVMVVDIQNQVQDYDLSKGNNILYVEGCYETEEDEDKAIEKAKKACLSYKKKLEKNKKRKIE